MDQLAERYGANHARLVAARDRLQAAVDAAAATDDERRRLETVAELLAPVSVTAVDAEGKVVEVRRPRQFLEVDPDGQGRAVEVLGELDEARNIAVLVPGMGNSLDTFRGQADRGDLIRQESGPGTAVVVWLDYDSPQGLPAAASKQSALDGGPRLANFLTDLDHHRAPEAKTTLIGHSYGTDVVGQALLNGGRADRVVLTGSPGITKYVDEAADFVPTPTRLYVERAPGDYVAYSEWHGPDPATFPDAIRMATNDPVANDEAVSVHWHNEYYRPNSEALPYIGRVVRGDLDAITTTNTRRSAETKLLLGASWGGALNAVAGAASKVYDGVVSLTKPSKESARAAAEQGVSSRPADGARSRQGVASQPADGARSRQGVASQPADGARSRQGVASQPADGARSQHGVASQPADEARSRQGMASRPADGARSRPADDGARSRPADAARSRQPEGPRR